MDVLTRLKMELSNQEYFSDDQYSQFLMENNLTATETYNKETMYKQLLLTVLDVFEAVANDVDLMQSITTEFNTTGAAAYKYIEKRIAQVKDKIASIPDPDEDYSCFSLMFTREPQYTPSRYGAKTITPKEIDDMF